MDSPTVIPGKFVGHTFVPDGPLPDVEGPAELRIYGKSSEKKKEGKRSMFDYFGKAPVLRSGEDIDRQVEEEKRAWEDE